MMLGSFPISMVLLAWLRWAATGETFQHSSYLNFYVFMVADVLVGVLSGTLYQCNPNGALLEQTPGRPWVLENWENNPFLLSAFQ